MVLEKILHFYFLAFVSPLLKISFQLWWIGLMALFSLWKRVGSFIWTILKSFTKGCLLPSLVENWTTGSGDEDEKLTDRRTTDNRRSGKLTWPFSSGERKRIRRVVQQISVARDKHWAKFWIWTTKSTALGNILDKNISRINQSINIASILLFNFL